MKVIETFLVSATALLTFVLFALNDRAAWGQIRLESIEDPRIKQAVEMNESYIQSINEYHLQVFRRSDNEDTLTEFWKGDVGIRVLEHKRMKGANAAEMLPRICDRLYVFGEPMCRCYRYNEGEDLSKITPCDNRSLRAFHVPRNILKSELIPLAEAMLLVQYPANGSTSLKDMIENYATKIEWLGEDELNGKMAEHLRCTLKSPETSETLDQIDFWIDRIQGGQLVQYKFVFNCQSETPMDGFLLRVDKTLESPMGIVVACNTSRWYQGVEIGLNELNWIDFKLPSEVDPSTLGFKFPKYALVDYCETFPDGKLATSQEFRVIGNAEDDILFRCKSPLPDLHNWCFDSGFPKNPRNLNDGRLTLKTDSDRSWITNGVLAVFCIGVLILAGKFFRRPA